MQRFLNNDPQQVANQLVANAATLGMVRNALRKLNVPEGQHDSFYQAAEKSQATYVRVGGIKEIVFDLLIVIVGVSQMSFLKPR